MKKLFLILLLILTVSFMLVSCDEFMNDLVESDDETEAETYDITTSKGTHKETESDEEISDEETSDETAIEIDVIDINRIVNGGKVIKKHDPYTQVYSQTMGDYRVHLGIDIECEMNAPVNSMIDGAVIKIWEDSLMGNCVAISNGTYTVVYKNLSAQTANGIEEGSKVTIGQNIGYVGDSAMMEIADPPHLHLDLFKDDVCIDPLEFIYGGTDVEDDTHPEEDTTVSGPEVEISEVDMDTIVKGGKVIKKHNSELQVWSPTTQDYRVHLGIDIECEMNAPVFSMIDGEVTRIWSDALMGNCVSISNGTYVVIYKNLSAQTANGIEEGSKVEIGQNIGYVGDSAILELADEPHLHLEMTKNDLSIDPLEFICGGTDVEDETPPEEDTTVSGPEVEISEVDMDTIVKGGKVIKKHDPYTQVYSQTMGDYRVHLGIDIECEMNAPVFSMIDGEVTKIWSDALMGNCVAISNGTYTVVYKNLSAQTANGIEEGSKVTIGQNIGYVGDSAMIEIAEEPHLHLEITKGDLMIDPLEYIKE